ncbi:GIY-YIG nuclease family protein [Terriglobus roseus]|uniref:GIY-YIG catalytic domain-containing protein n=1 Tax=Terriglobus roseus TaxID=392734 RepID=A0A1H4J2M7_9BACT|nr:GIY-YIG nuclease family protein [Terriglobus roseus]SEB40487.1 GIY-YIG catalytic domain-containing protein [Terriglobus roseus]
MPIFFNSLLVEAEIQLDQVRLLRHQDNSSAQGRTPYELWRQDDQSAFDSYQSVQNPSRQAGLGPASLWASFVVTPDGRTLFAGLYRSQLQGLNQVNIPHAHREGFIEAGTCDVYTIELDERLSDLRGKLFVDWGPGTRQWVQRADNQNKVVTELLTRFKEPEFPGYLNFIQPLSQIESSLPTTWVSSLKQVQGVYLLTCPLTKELYVGSATGVDGFWGRWSQYVSNNHGGNIQLKSRDHSDYQVSILEVAGSGTTTEEIIAMEDRWKKKLQSREMGLNSN